MKYYLAFFIFFVSLATFGQNTLKFDSSVNQTSATINEVTWIAGYWLGEAFGGKTEEVWTTPLGNSMMGSFKLVVDEKVEFYELCTISEENGSLIFRLKHFHNNLKGWEEKDEMLEAKLVKIEENKAFFDDFTFERVNETTLNIYVVFKDDEGQEEEMKFSYTLKE
jgi:hypothetical protein